LQESSQAAGEQAKSLGSVGENLKKAEEKLEEMEENLKMRLWFSCQRRQRWQKRQKTTNKISPRY
jgi:predicted DNA-binding protein YlxM (UPF0122 family)